MSNLKYRADIDGLRAVAVLGVVIYHAFPWLIPGGFIGVDIFFVISGYLISGILYKGHNTGNFSFKEGSYVVERGYWRRCLRSMG
jgi:peptidoglycan/LPS O-acetylase OafA/YrhL